MDGYEYLTKPKAPDSQTIKGDKWRIQVLTEGLVRCEWADDGHFEDRASTFAINRDLPPAAFRSYEKDGVLNIVTDRFHFFYDKKPFSASGLFLEVSAKDLHWDNRWRFPDFGSSLGGTARTLDDVDGRCELGPGVVSQKGFAALDDKDSMLFDGKNWISGRRSGDRQDLYVFAYGLDHRDAIKAFYAVSGKQPEVPRFAFGNWWSRYHAYSAKEYTDLMDRFAAEDVPLSIAVVDMDWHWVHEKRVTHHGWTGYSWNKDLFPDPEAFIKNIKSRDLKITLNDHPADGIHPFEDVYAQMAKDMGFDVSHQDPIPFDCTNPKFVKAYLDMWHSIGVDFDWIDWQQGTNSAIPGIDPLWVLNHYHYLDNQRINKPPMIFSRYAGPGSHRYPVGFSGDSHVTWDSLHFQPEFTATASNIGFGWWSHDIGGHMFGERNDEMVARWVQYGAFSPFLRLHSTHSRWMSKEPWRYNAESCATIDNIMRFRHRLIPYLHTMNKRAHRDDEPLVQPVYWAYPRRSEAYEHRNSYYFGSQLFVAPITSERSASSTLGSTQAWLPPGPRCWVDIFTGLIYGSDRLHTFYRPLHQIPVVAAEGTILPLDGAYRPKNGTHNPVALELALVPGVDCSFTLIEDVADDPSSLKSSGADAHSERRTTFTWNQAARKLAVKQEGGDVQRPITVRFIGTKDGHAIGNEAPKDASKFTFTGAEWTAPGDVSVELGAPPLESRLEPLVEAYQCSFSYKERIWDLTTAPRATIWQRIGALLHVKIPQELIGPVLEVMLASVELAG